MLVRIAKIAEAKPITGVINAAFRNAESFFIERDRIDLEKVQSLLRSGKFLISGEDGGLNPKLPCHFVKMSKPLT